MLSVVVIDDELLALNLLSYLLDNFTSVQLKVVGKAMNLTDVIELIKRTSPDLVFLDIEMPELNGFELIGSLDHPPNIIIISSAEEYAFKAFDFNVVDYLLKPVTYARFCKAIDKTIRYFARKETPNTGDEEIFIKKGSSLVKLKLKEIIYIEALENYVTLSTNDDKFTIHFTMKAIENQLASGIFIRVHRSFIVNKNMIQTINDDSLDLIVGDTFKILPIGKSFRDLLLNNINMINR